jgi:hypothetical protein
MKNPTIKVLALGRVVIGWHLFIERLLVVLDGTVRCGLLREVGLLGCPPPILEEVVARRAFPNRTAVKFLLDIWLYR